MDLKLLKRENEIIHLLSIVLLIGSPFISLVLISLFDMIEKTLSPPPPPPPGLLVEGSPMAIFGLILFWGLSSYGCILSGILLRYKIGKFKNKTKWSVGLTPLFLISLYFITSVWKNITTPLFLRNDDLILFFGFLLLFLNSVFSTNIVLTGKTLKSISAFLMISIYTFTPAILAVLLIE